MSTNLSPSTNLPPSDTNGVSEISTALEIGDNNQSMDQLTRTREQRRVWQQQRRQRLTPEECAQERERNRKSQQLRLQSLTPEDNAQRLERRRITQQRWRVSNRAEQTMSQSQTERWRNYARQRRAATSNEQRGHQLARRRSNYRQRQRREPVVDFSNRSSNTVGNSRGFPNEAPGPTNFFNGVPTRRRSTSIIRRPRTSQLPTFHTEANSQMGNESSSTPFQGNISMRMRSCRRPCPAPHPQSTHLPVIPEEETANVFDETPPMPNQAQVRMRTQLTPLSHFTPNQATYEHGSTSSSTSDRRDEQTFQNFAQEDEIEAAPLFEEEVQANHMESDTRTFNNVTRHNCARDFHEYHGIPRSLLPAPRTCRHCHARLFLHETTELCCKSGKTVLPPIPAPPEMTDLFCEQTTDGRHFRKNIRAYNHVFSFTSMGVDFDEELAGGSRGVYTFRAHGAIYHRIGSLLPYSDQRPRYLQLYIYDTDHEIENRMSETSGLRRHIVKKLKHILDAHNPFVHNFRQMAQSPDIQNYKLIIKEQPVDRRQYDLPTASQVAAIIVGGDEAALIQGRDIAIQTIGGNLRYIQDIVGFYGPMQYPLLLPYGTYGWDVNSHNDSGTKLTCRDFYAYRLQIRPNDQSLLLRGGRLLQQYVVDNYVKIESQKLRWMRSHQNEIRSDLYDGLQDSVHMGINNAGDVGHRTILASSFVGSPRDMYQRYQDAMALVQKYGKPDLFLTMTCNGNWPEIRNELLPGQTASDRPDLVARVFRSKFEEFKKDILTKHVLGKVIAYVYVIENQKRGLPHAHIVLILDENDKFKTLDDYDCVVRAEIPDKEAEPELYNAVIRHMIHGPCGPYNVTCPCMKNGVCKKKFPKPFSNVTTMGEDSYPVYRRRPPRHSNSGERPLMDNSWVVPYNPWLLLKYDCHINVEICSSIVSVKYLYKYVYKGPDRVSVEVRPGPNYDEIQQYVDARWVCAPEAVWKIFKFLMSRMYPSVERLQIHLPNKQQVTFYQDQRITDVLSNDRCSRTMLTEFFATNNADDRANSYLYREFPQNYKWCHQEKKWEARTGYNKFIGRIYTVSPNQGDKFYLRLLLNHIRGPKSWDDLLTVDGVQCATFKLAAERRGLLECDNSIRQCLAEASNTRMPAALRRMFVTILVYCEPTGVRDLWDDFYLFMIEDYPSSSSTKNSYLINRLLRDLNDLLSQHNRTIADFDLPNFTMGLEDASTISKIIQDELSVAIPQQDVDSIAALNGDQKFAFDAIIGAIERNEGGTYFIDGPGGTGKTYLYRALLASLRVQGHIALATTSSGIAATLMPGGRTAHSRFKIPLNPDPSSVCSISKQSHLAELIRLSSVILWDEATMTNRLAIEALDRTLRDIIGVDMPFGGKVIVFGGDFRQVLPIVPKGTKAETINASIAKSPLWRNVQVLRLKQNMRSVNDQEFSNFLLRVGDGNEPTIADDMMKVPSSMVIPWEDDNSIDKLIDEVFPNLESCAGDSTYMVDRGLITPKNEHVELLNKRVNQRFSGRERVYYSFDRVENDTQNLYQQEFLNSIAPGGLPPHELRLKVGAPIMLLRNLDPRNGLCNGTRLLCRALNDNFIDAEILTGAFKGTRTFLHGIPLKTPENMHLPFEMIRCQFPVRLSFALTINKSQGQTIPHVGIYLPEDVFSHGQFYVGLSRGTSQDTTKILVKNGNINRQEGMYTKNVVYKEVLLPSG